MKIFGEMKKLETLILSLNNDELRFLLFQSLNLRSVDGELR